MNCRGTAREAALGRVRQKKHLSGCKCGNRPPLAGDLCAQQPASPPHQKSLPLFYRNSVPSALLRRKMLLLRKSILMSHGFPARSRASIRSAAKNRYRRNLLPPLNNLNQAETRSAASRSKKVHDFRRGLFLEQGTGVEPALTAWEAAVIPIYQPCERMKYIIFFVSFQGEIFMLYV